LFIRKFLDQLVAKGFDLVLSGVSVILRVNFTDNRRKLNETII